MKIRWNLYRLFKVKERSLLFLLAVEGECAGDMLYETDRRHGLHHCGEQLAFPALA
jgi:hypothetical protein